MHYDEKEKCEGNPEPKATNCSDIVSFGLLVKEVGRAYLGLS